MEPVREALRGGARIVRFRTSSEVEVVSSADHLCGAQPTGVGHDL